MVCGAWLDLALSKNAWGMMDGTWAVGKIGLQFNRLIQVIGESVRIPGAWADIDGLRMSSLVALWNRLDCYRQSLAVPDPQAFCRGKVADQFAQHGCESSAARRPANFSAVPAVSSTQATPPPS